MRPPLPIALLSCSLCVGVGYLLGLEEPAPPLSPAGQGWVAGHPAACESVGRAPTPLGACEPRLTAALGSPVEAGGGARAARDLGGAGPSPVTEASLVHSAVITLRLDLRNAMSLELFRVYARHFVSIEGHLQTARYLRQALEFAPGDAGLLEALCAVAPLEGLATLERAARAGAPSRLPYVYVQVLGSLAEEDLSAVERAQARAVALELVLAEVGRYAPEEYLTTSWLEVLGDLDPGLALEHFRRIPGEVFRDSDSLEAMASFASEIGDEESALRWGLEAAGLDPDYARIPLAKDVAQLRQLEASAEVHEGSALRRALALSYLELGRHEDFSTRVDGWLRSCGPDDLGDLVTSLYEHSDDLSAEFEAEAWRLAVAAVRASPWSSDHFMTLTEVDPARAVEVYEELAERDPRLGSQHGSELGLALEELAGSRPDAVLDYLSGRPGRVSDASTWQRLVSSALHEAEEEASARQLYRLGKARFPELAPWEEIAAEESGTAYFVGGVLTFD